MGKNKKKKKGIKSKREKKIIVGRRLVLDVQRAEVSWHFAETLEY